MLRMAWKKAVEIGINGQIPLTIYHSKRSNLRVAIAATPGPMVNGRITFATETRTDDGLPHTLEHLVFMGSELYPYKGVLDIIANRCLASGTNACTDQDHTAYMLSTAGSSGFLKVLPVYLDHLLMPNLTESQYITEVHHINGKGQDSGVVYSEMQDRESEMSTMADRKRKELFYPKGSSYAAVTGGALHDLRHVCSNERVRNYHKDFYHLQNMFITVCGKIDHQMLLESIEPVEQRNLDKIPKKFEQPFQSRVPPITEPKSAKIVCPSDDESLGMVEISWLGPQATEVYTTKALAILFDYLTETSVAPLRKDFVQVADPFCSSIEIAMMEQRDCEIIVGFSGVPLEKLEQIRDRFFEKTVSDHKHASAFDVERFGYILDQQIRLFLSKLENNPSSMIIDAIIGHQLYGQDSDPDYQLLDEGLNEVTLLRKLKAEPAEFWHSLFHKYFVPNCVCLMAEPSEKAVDEFTEREEKRTQKQIEQLGGEKGLEECQKRLDKAIFDNTHNKPSDEVLRELIVRDFEHFNMIDVSTITNFGTSKDSRKTFIDKLPFPAILHTVPSDFFDSTILIDVDNLPVEDRHFLMLWFELMFQSPAVVDGKELSYEEVARLATKDLVTNSVSVGVAGVYDRFMTLKLRVDNEHFANLAKWAKIYLKGIRFDPTRIAICAKKLAANAADSKRDGNSVCHFLNTASTYLEGANTSFYSHIGLEKFHKQIAKAVEGSRTKSVLDKLEDVRRKVLNCPMNVHFSGDPDRIKQSVTPNEWADFSENSSSKSSGCSYLKCPADHGADWSMVGQSRAITVGGSESAFLLQKTKFDGDWNGPNTMETLLLAQYLVQCEGPLWCAIRGTGLAYDASIYLLPDRKALSLELYRCSQLAEAYAKTKDTVLEILGSGKLDERLLESAKRSLVCELIGGQSTVKLTAVSALLSTIRGVGLDLTLKLCSRIWHASPEEVLEKAAPAISQLFDEQKSVRSVTLNPSRLSELKEHFPGTKVLKIDELQVRDVKL